MTSLRILAVADVWHGSNGDAYVRAFRRLGHSVRVVPAEGFVATEWRSAPLRMLRRLLDRRLVAEYNRALLDAAREHEPDIFFVYKGRHVTAGTITAIRRGGAAAINVYPDVSLLAHGPHIPKALPAYSWVFHTKTYGVADLQRLLGVRHASVLPHGFDPDVHRPVALGPRDRARYDCDVSFIGTWSPKKQAALEHVCAALPEIRIRIWGAQWERARARLGPHVEGRGVHGTEYAKALVASRVNLGILSEARLGASSGDAITSRTFHIPATGAFMLHERTDELLQYFTENVHCGAYASHDELVAKIREFLADDRRRTAMAAAGHRHVHDAGHSLECRARSVIEHTQALDREMAS